MVVYSLWTQFADSQETGGSVAEILATIVSRNAPLSSVDAGRPFFSARAYAGAAKAGRSVCHFRHPRGFCRDNFADGSSTTFAPWSRGRCQVCLNRVAAHKEQQLKLKVIANLVTDFGSLWATISCTLPAGRHGRNPASRLGWPGESHALNLFLL